MIFLYKKLYLWFYSKIVSEPERKRDRAVCPSTFRSVCSIARDLVIFLTVLLPPLDVDTLLEHRRRMLCCEHGDLLIRCESVSSKSSHLPQPPPPTVELHTVSLFQGTFARCIGSELSPWSHRQQSRIIP